MKDLILLLPEAYLIASALGILISEVGYHGERVRLIYLTALIGLAGAFVQTIICYQFGASQFFGHTLVNDGFSLYFKLFLIGCGSLTIFSSGKSQEVAIDHRAEYCASVLTITAMLMAAVASADLLLIFVCTQVTAVLGTLLVAQNKNRKAAIEASIKKLGMGLLAFVLLGFGIVFLFALTKSFNIYEIHAAILAGGLPEKSVSVAFMLVLAGLSFQMALFPMHLWATDTLEGAPPSTAILLSVGARGAAVAVMIRTIVIVFTQPGDAPGLWKTSVALEWPELMATLAAASMLFGALLAYRQRSVRRLLASLIVVQTGFLMLGFLILDEVGLSALLYNLLAELFAVGGAYAAVSYIVDRTGSDRFDAFRGVLSRSVPESVALVVFLGSLVGFPPFPGFIGKFTLISAAIRHQWGVLAIVAAGAMVISMVAAARLLYYVMSDFKEFRLPALAVDRGHRVFILSLLLPLMLMSLFAEALLQWAGQSVQFIFW